MLFVQGVRTATLSNVDSKNRYKPNKLVSTANAGPTLWTHKEIKADSKNVLTSKTRSSSSH